MIEALHLRNFKCFTDQRFEFKALTLLTGQNGMGKSSVIQSILLLQQSALSGALSSGYLETSGNLIDLGTPSDVFKESAKTDFLSIEVKTNNCNNIKQFNFLFDRNIDKFRYSPSKNYTSESDMCNTDLFFLANDQSDSKFKFQYLSAERNGPRKFLPMSTSRIERGDIGSRGEYVFHFFDNYKDLILDDADPRHMPASGDRLRDQVEAWLGEISPGVSLHVDTMKKADLIVGQFSFGAPGVLRSSAFRATHVGFGLSYVLPVIVSLLAAGKNGMVIIENPEAHLHPRGQTKLGELAARAAASGAQIIVETHSDHFLDGARLAVKKLILSHNDLAIYYFSRNGAEIDVLMPIIDKNGRLDSWPDGFFDQQIINSAELIRPLDSGDKICAI